MKRGTISSEIYVRPPLKLYLNATGFMWNFINIFYGMSETHRNWDFVF